MEHCPACGQHAKVGLCTDMHDPCIANCPDTDDACCGHGLVGEAYVSVGVSLPYKDRIVLRGTDAAQYFLANLGVSIPDSPTELATILLGRS